MNLSIESTQGISLTHEEESAGIEAAENLLKSRGKSIEAAKAEHDSIMEEKGFNPGETCDWLDAESAAIKAATATWARPGDHGFFLQAL